MSLGHRAATTASLAAAWIAGAFLFAGRRPQQSGPSRQPDADLEHGQALYSMHCRRCHGIHGDDITCSGDMTPLAGIARRAREGLVAQFMSPSYYTRGVFFEGSDARNLTTFLLGFGGTRLDTRTMLLEIPGH